MPISSGFNQSRIWGRRVLSGLIACGLTAGVLMIEPVHSPAHAFLFFHKKKSPLPPSAQSRPGLIQAPVVPPVVKTPSVPVQPIDVLIKQGVFPPDAATRTQPITRAEWATLLVKAIGHDTTLVSEFPFYRDVPLSHPAYVPIEVAREKKLITYGLDHGDYYPAQPVTYGEAYLALAHAITGPPPTLEMVPHLLQGFKDRDQLPMQYSRAVAKMVRVHFFKLPVPQTLLHPNEDVTYVGVAPLITELIHLIQLRAPLQAEKEAATPLLPAGLNLTLSPTTSILEVDLNVGQVVSFTLVNPVGILPKESHFEGQVVAATPAARNYTVELTSVKTPGGDEYQTDAEIVIAFSPRSRINFLVPGELFSTLTKLPDTEDTRGTQSVIPVEPASTTKPVIPFAPPSSSSAPAPGRGTPIKKQGKSK